jgi:hypothetical protein
MYADLGVDHTTKSVIYSDSVNLDLALKLVKQCAEEGFKGKTKKEDGISYARSLMRCI